MKIPMAFDQEEAGKFNAQFDNIRARIDTALSIWLWVPDPSEITPMVEALRQCNRRLALEAVSEGGTVTGGGEIGGNINLAMLNSAGMSGGMMTAFKSNFLSQLGKTIGGLHALTVVLGSVIAAEEKMWGGARETIVDIVESSTEAFNAAAAGNGPEWDVILKVVGYAVSGAAIFATGGAATALSVAGLGLTIAEGAIPGEAAGGETQAPVGDYDSVIESFEAAFDDLKGPSGSRSRRWSPT